MVFERELTFAFADDDELTIAALRHYARYFTESFRLKYCHPPGFDEIVGYQ
jgi:hypothetical protein